MYLYNFLRDRKYAFCSFLQDPDDGGEPLVIRNSGLAHRVSAEEGKDYVFTVKLFLSRWDRTLIKQAVQASKSRGLL